MTAAAADAPPGEFVEGLFSRLGKQTEFEIRMLQGQVDPALQGAAGAGAAGGAHGGPGRAGAQGRAARSAAPAERPRWAPEELKGGHAKAAQGQARLRAALRPDTGAGPKEPAQASRTGVQPKSRATAAFAALGMDDGVWSSRFTASMSQGALNRLKTEERPDPGWYKIQYGAVLERQPAANIKEYPKHPRLERDALDADDDDDQDGAAFMTGVDGFRFSNAAASRASGFSKAAASRVSAISDLRGSVDIGATAAALPTKAGGTAMALNTERGPLGKIGRVHVLMHEVSCPAKDLYQQDIKGQPKLRYPSWDFSKSAPRGGLMRNADDVSAPGKYDVLWGNGVTSAAPKAGIAFDRAISRSESQAGQLGYGAPQAILLPEERRNPGRTVAPDRSCAKDSVRRRVTHVNDFETEAPRPDRHAGGKDQRSEARASDAELPAAPKVGVAFRKSISRATSQAGQLGYGALPEGLLPGVHMGETPRGRARPQAPERPPNGPRSRTPSPQSRFPGPLPARRASAADRERPDLGPVFDHYSNFQQLLNHNNFNHGHPPVQGPPDTNCWEPKQSPMRKHAAGPFGAAAYKRRASAPGYRARAPKALGGAPVPAHTRSHEAMCAWAGGSAPAASPEAPLASADE